MAFAVLTDERDNMTVKTAHRQFGSKARTANAILAMVPDHTVWVEVFAGSAAVTLAKEPSKAEHINDINGDVVTLFQVMRDDDQRERLCELIDLTPWSQIEYQNCWPADAVDDPVERARRFLVRSWQGVGGMQNGFTGWRLQRDDGWCPRLWRKIPLRLRSVAQRMRDVHIHQKDCVEMVRRFADIEDLVYFIDPPYPEETLNTQRQQPYSVSMSSDEHQAFAEALLSIKGKAVLTMNPGTVYDDVLSDWRRRELPVRGLRNTTKNEVIYMNFDINDEQQRLFS
jgi:DNA adenine methylase